MLHISVNENIFVEEYKVVMDFNEDVFFLDHFRSDEVAN